jgi:hypothetical protein
MPIFRFVQVEYPWALGPPEGRYLLRREGDPPEATPSEVIVLATLGAPERRRLQRKRRKADREPDPVPVTVTRATMIELGQPFENEAAASRWLDGAGDDELDAGLFVLNRALHVYRLVTADPYVVPVGRHGALVLRLGYGAGEQVSDGLWTNAIELIEKSGRQSRTKILTPQAHLAAVLNGREQRLACEELVLRARLDYDAHRYREAALQTMIALDAAIAEITADRTGPRLGKRLEELSSLRDGIAEAGQQALAGPVDDEARERVDAVLRRVESVLRARAVLNA